MTPFLKLNYYFAAFPNSDFHFSKITFSVALLVLLSGFALGIYRKKYLKDETSRKILKPYPGKLSLYGFLALCLLAFREGGIPYLSMRIWWFVLLAFFLVTFLRLAFGYKKEYSRRQERAKKKDGGEKYLPKKKR